MTPQILLFAEDWQKGPSAFCDPDYVRLTLGGGTVVDTLYPYIAEAEAVQVLIGQGPNGENVLDCDTSGGTEHIDAGVMIYRPFPGVTELEAFVWVKPTTAALDFGLYYSLPIWFSTNLGQSAEFETAIDGDDEVNGPFSWNVDTALTATVTTPRYLTRAYIENMWFQLRVRAADGASAGQGWVSLDVRRQDDTTWTPALRVNNLTLTLANLDSFGLGFAGLIQTTGVRIYSGFGEDDAINAPLDPCCATSGTAGGGTLGTDGQVTPVGPRQGTTGGIPPSYTPCTGGGALTTATDPTDPQNLDSATDPIVHLKLTPASSAAQRWGTADINAGTTSPPIAAKVLSYSPIHTEVLAGRDGVLPSHGFSVRLADTDRQIGTWMETADRYWLNRFAELLVEEYGQRKIDTEARKLSAGYTVSLDWLEDLVVEFGFADVIGWRVSALKSLLPKQLVDPIWAPGAPEDSLGRPVPWIYGEMSDDYQWSLDPNRMPVGIVPCIPLGFASTLTFTNALLPFSTGWQAFLIGKVCKTFTAQYLWNGRDAEGESQRSRIIVDFPIIVDTLLPTQAGWSNYFSGSGHVRVQGSDGSLQDFTMAFSRGPRAYEAGTTLRFPWTFNMCGIEDVGDGTGDMIADGAHALAHFLCYGVFMDHRFGPWGAIPALPNGAPVINRASVDTVKTIHDLRLSGGYLAAFTVGAVGKDRQQAEVVGTEIARGIDIKFGRNHFGQLLFSTLDDQADISSLVAFDDSSIRNFRLSPSPDLFENAKTYDYGPEPSTGRNSGLVRRIVDTASVVNWGETREGAIRTNIATRVKAVADDVAMRELLRDSNVPQPGSFETDQRGLSLSAGQLITITSEYAPGSTGWDVHVVQVTAVVELANDAELLTRIEFDDVDALLTVTALQASIFTPSGLATGPAWGNPIGSTADGTAQPLGSEATGTARRLS